MSELKPCPFCNGGGAYVKHSAGVSGTMGFDSWHAVACRSCGATVGACDRRFRNKDDAAAAWNLRPAPEQREPVAVVGSDFALFWAGSEPVADIVHRHGIKVGSPLYATPPRVSAPL